MQLPRVHQCLAATLVQKEHTHTHTWQGVDPRIWFQCLLRLVPHKAAIIGKESLFAFAAEVEWFDGNTLWMFQGRMGGVFKGC